MYGPQHGDRGGNVAFNLRDARGRLLPCERVARALAKRRISVRSGCFCNPGAAERAFGLDAAAVGECLRAPRDRPFMPGELRRCVTGRAVGAVRCSVGIPTTHADIYRLVAGLADVTAGALRRGNAPAENHP